MAVTTPAPISSRLVRGSWPKLDGAGPAANQIATPAASGSSTADSIVSPGTEPTGVSLRTSP